VYAHIYHSHFQVIMKLQEEAHLNTCFKHFTLFTLVILNALVCHISWVIGKIK
jgi:MOB kinase activator 1